MPLSDRLSAVVSVGDHEVRTNHKRHPPTILLSALVSPRVTPAFKRPPGVDTRGKVLKSKLMTYTNKSSRRGRRQLFPAGLGVIVALALGSAMTEAREITTEGPVPGGGMAGIYVPVPVDNQKSLKALILTDFDFNDMETFYPMYRFTEEGIAVTVATPVGGNVQGYGGHIILDTVSVADLDVTDFDILYLPGGKAPATLRENPAVIEAVQKFAATGKPIAAICHGPQILVTAGLVDGKNIACFADVGQEVEAAGGTYLDEPVAVDGSFITSRLPKDLPRQMEAILQKLHGGS
jgi:protease I